MQKKDLEGASLAFKKSLKATSRLSVLAEAASKFEIDAFDPTTTASSSPAQDEKEGSPDMEDPSGTPEENE